MAYTTATIPSYNGSTMTSTGYAPYWTGTFDIVNSVGCSNCPAQFKTGLGGEAAMSVSDAAVAAHANGWYIGGCNICAECRVLMIPKESTNGSEETE